MKAQHRMSRADAIRFLSAAPEVTLCVSGGLEEDPLMRTLHAVVIDDAVYFHASKHSALAQRMGCRGVVSAVKKTVTIPSHFRDPERACPATTYYESVMARGVLELVESMETRASALAALMRHLQPEGGYRPITAASPLYEKPLRSLCVFRLSLDVIDGKLKMGQRCSEAQREGIFSGLWRRGALGDLEALEKIRAASGHTPSFLRDLAPTSSLRVWLDVAALDDAAALLEGAYWLEGVSREKIRSALCASHCIGAYSEGALVGFARAVSDGSRRAWIYDMIVREDHRGAGLGSALMRLLLDHPSVRRASAVHLGTRDAQAFYRRLGFIERDRLRSGRGWVAQEMIRASSASGGG